MTLIEQLERADGPDRELDAEIWASLGNCNHARTKYYCIEDGNDTDSGFTCLDCGKDTYGAKSAPAYTASIDAAVTLVPEGWGYSTKVPSDELPMLIKHTDLPKEARVWRSGVQHQGIANTPALALCIAALRARSQGGE